MSTRITKFYVTVPNAAGEPVTVHVFSDMGERIIEVLDKRTLIFGNRVFEEDLARIDSTVLRSLARKLQAYERARSFVERFGFGLWRGW